MRLGTASGVALGVLLSTATLAVGASAQQSGSPSPAQAETPTQADILLKFTAPPSTASPPDSLTRDDLRPLPPPRPDPLSESVRFSGAVGDPLCLPGDEMWLPPERPRRSRRH